LELLGRFRIRLRTERRTVWQTTDCQSAGITTV